MKMSRVTLENYGFRASKKDGNQMKVCEEESFAWTWVKMGDIDEYTLPFSVFVINHWLLKLNYWSIIWEAWRAYIQDIIKI